MHYEGKIYRPWIEAESILIQTTLGCSNNQCTFCTMFDDKRFKVRDIKDIFLDIEEARTLYPYVESIFLIDGNVMAIRTEMLIAILDKIKTTFPEIKNISLYSGFNDFRRKSLSELKEIHSAGLTMAYSGLESGDPTVLKRIKKKMSREHAIEGMALARDANIKVLASFIFGLGGRERSVEHAVNTTSLLNIMQPDAIAPMALAIQPGSELEREVARGEFTLPTPLQILEEEKYLLENMNGFDCYYWGDHGNNISPMRGMLPAARDTFLGRINQNIAMNPITKENVIQTFAW
ncbi:coproporphyrinogen III oxidase [Vibrio sp. 10N.286.49.C2]|uniref:radical SAM protein n=1 Tax=unclassified Vibrio TaxID=2614977 RepID=UPI000C85E810|nr:MULTISPECIES: radical SAM protein [unclassified Vibrio]PMH30339.1 coproporphyrinogen III oxidase [Vibrio sp. 10N.286.49.C2]PMH50840.1 coproporphyrinogen III oxidase [Vibrio sp. 10N.286.49.B1]PMH79552.1 coproporphyrinogen III oxidase [Vibrio sp. 10N.286.48.B7]